MFINDLLASGRWSFWSQQALITSASENLAVLRFMPEDETTVLLDHDLRLLLKASYGAIACCVVKVDLQISPGACVSLSKYDRPAT